MGRDSQLRSATLARRVGWLMLLLGAAAALLGYLLARDSILVGWVDPWLLEVYRGLNTAALAVMGLWLGTDVLELLLGAAAFAVAAFGAGILLGLRAAGR
jgi:hypothetical protein